MKKIWILIAILLVGAVITALSSCGSSETGAASDTKAVVTETATDSASDAKETTREADTAAVTAESDSAIGDTVTVESYSGGALAASDLFTERDLTQVPDLTDAVYLTLSSGEDVSITSAGVYVISGSASDVTVTVDAADDDKVQIVLDGVDITNSDFPCIYVKNADKVFVTTTDSENSLSVTGTFVSDGTTNTDAVIFSKDDIILNGVGSLSVTSTDNGVTSKDDLKITGGEISIEAADCALEANDSVRIADGNISITAGTDGIHAENDDDDSTGFVLICGGTIDIGAADDGIHAVTIAEIDSGEIAITAAEGIEATWVQINGGNVTITASDDGINGANKSSAYTATVEFNGGYTKISMGRGDTDGVDSNGDIYVNGGTVDVTGQSTFDYDGAAEYNGGTIIVNGSETDSIPNQMMGGMGGPGRR